MSFFNDFFGKSQQRDLAAGKAQSDALINQYGQQSRDAYSAGAKEAQGYYQPYAQAGGNALAMYQNSLGLNGASGSQTAQNAYQTASNPYLSYEQDMAQKGLDRAANARGAVNSGGNALAAARARMGLGYQDYQNWQNRLQGQQGMGLQTAGAQAGIAQQTGQYLGDSLSGQGQQLAGNAINYSNALASSRNIGINNLMGVAGLGMKAFGGGWGGGGTPTQYGGRSPGGVYPGQSWG